MDRLDLLLGLHPNVGTVWIQNICQRDNSIIDICNIDTWKIDYYIDLTYTLIEIQIYCNIINIRCCYIIRIVLTYN
jgi:hypothetical protein